jgi:dTDP-4-amino-4,6-dideoxygalactose transaminase
VYEKHVRENNVLVSQPDPTGYESDSARAVGARHAIAFGFARHGLASLFLSAGLKRGDEVALSPLTCKVVPLALLSAGLRPVYVDISPGTLNLDPERLDGRPASGLRAVMFQHTYGRDAGVRDTAQVAERHGWLLVEDCAQCVPVTDATYAPGVVGRAAVFSNNLLKPLPAGSGGLVTTNDDELARRIRSARDALPVRGWLAEMKMRATAALSRQLLRPASYWTLLRWYRQISSTYKEGPVEAEIEDEITRLAVRPSRFQMAEGSRWLARLGEIASHRRTCCADYDRALRDWSAGWEVPPGAGAQPLLYFPVLTGRKVAVLRAARSARLPIIPWPGSTPIYPVERLDALRSYGYEPGSCPIAESIASRLIGLPTDPDITADHRRRIAAVVKDSAIA